MESSSHLLNKLLRRGLSDEAADVHIDKGGHEELAVEPVHDPTVPRDDVSEILERERKKGFFFF